MLENALNKGNKPPIIADSIEVVELEMGTQASSLSTPTTDRSGLTSSTAARA
jgi:hypothetical protein